MKKLLALLVGVAFSLSALGLAAVDVAVAQDKKMEEKKDDTKKDQAPGDRFRIIRLEAKGDKRLVGEIKVAVYGKISQDAKFVPTTTQAMKGGWVKVTPTDTLPSGEYAVVEMLGKEGMNLYVWDFGVNPNAAANSIAFKQDPSGVQAKPESIELQKRKKQATGDR